MVESITVRGQIKFNGASNLTIRGCTVEAEADGIVTQTRSENLFIADNTVRGSTSWAENALGVDGDNIGEGILVNGPGHVIQNNFVTGFRDGISFVEGEGQAVDQRSIDVLYNDIYDCADDGIEADFCMGNCRIVGNRLTNTFIALSSQPGLGGPTYFVRNALYNVVEVTLEVFVGPVDYPSDPFPAAAGQDLRIDETGAAVDVGTVIPGINDDHAGAGPDLGAYEAGEALPAYGPR